MKEAAKLDKARISVFLICGILGCLCFGGGDWLMMYGNPAYTGTLYWLTDGAANIPAWRNTLAMALSFPGIVLYGIGLLGISEFIKENRRRKIYKTLTAYGFTPWIALHLFYVMILFLYAWLHKNGFAEAANAVCEAIYRHFKWLPLVCELIMIPPFVYWIYLQLKGATILPKGMALFSALPVYAVLYLIKTVLPVSAFRLGFANGLMSEAMVIWFAALLVWTRLEAKRTTENQ